MTKDNLDVTEAMIEAGMGALYAVQKRGVGVEYDLASVEQVYLAMQSAREPKPTSPPTGDVVEAVQEAILKEIVRQDGFVVDIKLVTKAALATLQPADPKGQTDA